MVWEDGALDEHKKRFKQSIEKVFQDNRINGVTVYDVYCDVAGEGIYYAELSTPTMNRQKIFPTGPWDRSDDLYMSLAKGIYQTYTKRYL